MPLLSDPTLSLVVQVAADNFSISDLRTLLMRADLYKYVEGNEANRQELVRSRLLEASNNAAFHGTNEAEQALLSFIRVIVERTVRIPEDAPPWFGELREALLADGYELRWELEGDGDDWDHPVSRYQILSTDVSPTPLGREISALEAELSSRGYSDALNNYRQAVDAFPDPERRESANSQLRTMLEDLVMRLAEEHTRYARRPTRAGDGANAINHLIEQPELAAEDGGDMLTGLWKMIHTRGPHPGRSDADETRFRMHVITATARLLLHRFHRKEAI